MEQQRYNKQRGIITRACSCCMGDLGDRYGRARYCKACHAKYMRTHRPKHTDLPEEARHKANVRALSGYYVKKGIIKKEPCKVCGSNDSQRHHPDYNQPMLIEWYCRPCHLSLHKCNNHNEIK